MLKVNLKEKMRSVLEEGFVDVNNFSFESFFFLNKGIFL